MLTVSKFKYYNYIKSQRKRQNIDTILYYKWCSQIKFVVYFLKFSVYFKVKF